MSCFSYGGEGRYQAPYSSGFLCRPPNTPTHARSTPPLKPPPPWGHKKRRPPTKGTPTHKKNCGSHLLSHTHQDAVPSTPQGLATRFEKETERFPPAITTAKPHNNTFTGDYPRKEWLVASKLYSEHKHTKQMTIL